MEHVRIDEGIKRGQRPEPTPPHELETKARDEAGQFITRYSPELRQKAIEQSLIALECGARVEGVGEELGIPRSTLYSWLIGDERAIAYRTRFFDGQCAASLSEMRDARAPLDLTRARESLAGWLKVAERRDPSSYGLKTHVTVELTGDLGDRLRRSREREIQGEVVASTPIAALHSPETHISEDSGSS